VSRPPRIKGAGFTLVEALLVVLLLGILSAVLAGGLGGLVPAGRQEAAVSKARILNAARCSYALLVPSAESQWGAAADDGARIALLVEARVMDGTASGLLSSPGGYTLALSGALRDPTVLRKNGSDLEYLQP
jgi:type II secretory pathway pseudopilin PulG